MGPNEVDQAKVVVLDFQSKEVHDRRLRCEDFLSQAEQQRPYHNKDLDRGEGVDCIVDLGYTYMLEPSAQGEFHGRIEYPQLIRKIRVALALEL